MSKEAGTMNLVELEAEHSRLQSERLAARRRGDGGAASRHAARLGEVAEHLTAAHVRLHLARKADLLAEDAKLAAAAEKLQPEIDAAAAYRDEMRGSEQARYDAVRFDTEAAIAASQAADQKMDPIRDRRRQIEDALAAEDQAIEHYVAR